MQKVTNAGEDQHQAEFVGSLYGIFVSQTATGLNNGSNPSCCCRSHGVIEGEEPITGKRGTFSFLSSLFQSNLNRTDAIHLTSTNAQRSAIARHYNSI